MIYFCCDERRREVVKLQGTLNGLEYLEVHDSGAPGDPMRQLTLFVKFLRPVPGLSKDNLRIEGGERIKTVDIEWVAIANALPPGEPPSLVNGLTPLNEFLLIRTKFYGDFSIYTLRLVSGPGSDKPPAGFDPPLSKIQFSFKAQCKSDFDCDIKTICPPEPTAPPAIDYLAKDYASFRRMMLDRMALLIPKWKKRNPADLGMALVEILAYVGDYLSYQQDAIATEAYLDTARSRISVRRHARLVDYCMHDGCNARTWVHIRVSADVTRPHPTDPAPLPEGTQLLTRISRASVRISPGSANYQRALDSRPVVFETMHDAELFLAHNEMPFYTWGARECCLPRDATRATLNGHFPNLKKHDVLIFKEKIGPRTGRSADADPAKCHAVRLTKVTLSADPVGGHFSDLPNDDPVDITEIEWGAKDALPGPFCISARTDKEHGERYVEDAGVALGNIVLADHGCTIPKEYLGEVTADKPCRVPTHVEDHCVERQPEVISPRFYPHLQTRPVTQEGRVRIEEKENGKQEARLKSFDPTASATAAFRWEMKHVLPKVNLSDDDGNTWTWEPQRDLLGSDQFAQDFVVEVEQDGRAAIRFGDDQHGKLPNEGTKFHATYRVGNGVEGNVGADSLVHIVTPVSEIIEVTNPLPARGGCEPESIETVRQAAPVAFRTQERAVKPEDYAEIAERHEEVQRAAATIRWTGSWHTVFVTVDRRGGAEVDKDFEENVRRHLEPYRMAGYDLEVDGPRFVPLEIEMRVCVNPDYFRGHIKQTVLSLIGSGLLPDGRRGLFHPDNFTFGQPVHLSSIYEAAQAVEGVDSVFVETFQRMREPGTKGLDDGLLPMGRLEIARLDNDPNFPERGILRLTVGGGK